MDSETVSNPIDPTPARLKFVKAYTDRHGNKRYYYRRRGYNPAVLSGDPGSVEFKVAYEAAELQLPLYRSRQRAERGFVYVVRVRGFDLVKIGYSIRPTERIEALEAGSGMAGGLEMMMQFHATPAVERQLHRRFKSERLFGEWFRLSGPVGTWLASLPCAVAA